MTTAIATYEKPTDLPAITQFTTMANAITVVDADTRTFAAEQYIDIKAQRDSIEARRVARKAPALQICQDIDSDHQPIIKAADAFLTIVKGKIAAFDRAEKQRIANEQIEAERVQREALAKAEAAAAKLVRQGQIDKAEAVRALAAVAPAPVVAPAAAKVGGEYTRQVYQGRVTNPVDFLRFIADHPAYLNAVEFKQSVLNELARSTTPIPGFSGGLVDSLTIK